MQLVERHIRLNDPSLERVCFLAARLYNFCNYYIRQSIFGQVEKFTEYELTGLLAEFKQEDYIALPAQTSQQIIKLLYKNWKAYYAAEKEYYKDKSKFKGKPRLPKYKDKEGCGICVFTNQNTRLKNGYIHFPTQTGLSPLKTKVDNIAQVRIVPQATCFIIEVVYEKEITINHDIKEDNFLALDLGLNNLATSINNVGEKPFIINGRILKSYNQMFNKTRAKLMSFVGGKGTSNRLTKLNLNRNNFIEDNLHKTSRFIVNYCIEHHIGHIIIGHNKGWKDSINIGDRNNQNFVNLPHSKLIQKITYKAELVGIKVDVPEESHTSKVDHLALEPMKHQEVYLGKRVKRGLFQSSVKKLLNADVNGAIGIARKVFGDSVVKQIIDKGFAFNPVKLNIV